MKRITILFISLIFVFSARAQSLNPTVNATAGGYFSTPDVSLSWTLGEIATETFSGSSAILTQGFQQPNGRLMVSGLLSYQNSLSTPMTYTKVYLRTPAGLPVDSAITTSNGHFYFFDTPPGTYVFGLSVTKAWGGVNSADALKTTQHFVNLITLTDLYLKAADVNNSGYINSLDALLISKRFTGIISSFSVNDWLYTADTITLGALPVIHNLKTICTGDVNGSYIPAL